MPVALETDIDTWPASVHIRTRSKFTRLTSIEIRQSLTARLINVVFVRFETGEHVTSVASHRIHGFESHIAHDDAHPPIALAQSTRSANQRRRDDGGCCCCCCRCRCVITLAPVDTRWQDTSSEIGQVCLDGDGRHDCESGNTSNG